MALEFKVLLLPRAYKDLEDICNYIEWHLDAAQAAATLYDEFEKGIASLSVFPERGAERKTGRFANQGYRQLFVKNFNIIYRVDIFKRQVIIYTIRYRLSNF
ncbi:MAG: type II toxin-antitoxin system RelE/ParE family toxin [Acidaminococcaceae bacterium]|jgi:toxin ParE1/3/4|nr:type II toxin-antitoxin system RelE/ParE family toxin [Acidaminococcaceae bacterium]